MTRTIGIEPLTAAAFATFGDVIEAAGQPTRLINGDRCGRYHDLARLDFGDDGRAGISVFRSEPVTLPLTLDLMERHPDGSQAFLPLSTDPFLVVVAPDDNGTPGRPRAFLTAPGQGVNYLRGTWHGVLTPLDRPALFAVVDRIGVGANLEEHRFSRPYVLMSST
jgi:ureidoglycolate lyase